MAGNVETSIWETQDDKGLFYHSTDGDEIFFGYESLEYLKKFTKAERIKHSRERIVYLIVDNDNLAGQTEVRLNLGETKEDFINSNTGRIQRYSATKGCTNERRVLGVYLTNLSDHQMRELIKQKNIPGLRPIPVEENHSDEFLGASTGKTIDDLKNAIVEIIKNVDGDIVKVKTRKHIYKDILEDVGVVIGRLKSIFSNAIDRFAPIILASLPPRYGKTIFAIMLWLRTRAKYMFVCYYVGTVKNSFAGTLDKSLGFDNILGVDLTYELSSEMLAKIMDFAKKDENRLIFFLPLTGKDETFTRRLGQILPFVKQNISGNFCVVVDEADYGAHCKNQYQKIRQLNEIESVVPVWRMAMSGTGIEKAGKIWDDRKTDIPLEINDVEMSYRVNARKEEEI